MKQFLIMSILLFPTLTLAQIPARKWVYVQSDTSYIKGDTAYWFPTGGDLPETMGGRLPKLDHGKVIEFSDYISSGSAYWKTKYEKKAGEVKEYELLVEAISQINSALYAKIAEQERIIAIYKKAWDSMTRITFPPNQKTK